ncbi:Smg-6, nonsense mediated mRNA decay factor [Terramyces sp. JEL0728]|nr:Smg-6, nonsense mediated mRNA decay factor [Terramyces sp. JEL0728]
MGNQKLYSPNQKIKIISKPTEIIQDATDLTDARQIYKAVVNLEKQLMAPELLPEARKLISTLYIQLIRIDPKFIQKYDLNNRMWKNSIYNAIKKVKHNQEFIPLIETLLQDYSTLAKLETKFTGLYYCHRGDLYRYYANYFITESAEKFLALAQCEYQKAVEIQPANGLFWNQLGIVSGIRKKYLDSCFYFIRSLCVKQPFVNAKESLLNSISGGKQTIPFLELVEIVYSKVNVDKFEKLLCKCKKLESPSQIVQICIGLDYIVSTKYKEETLAVMKEYTHKLIQFVTEWVINTDELAELQLLLAYCVLENIHLNLELEYTTDLEFEDLQDIVSQTPIEFDKQFNAFEPLQKIFGDSDCKDNDNLHDRVGLLSDLMKQKGLVLETSADSSEKQKINEDGAIEFDFDEDFEDGQIQENITYESATELQYADFEPHEAQEELRISNITIEDDDELNNLIKLKQQLSRAFKLTKDTLVYIDTNFLIDNFESFKTIAESGSYSLVISTIVIKELIGLTRNERTSDEATALVDYLQRSIHLFTIQKVDGTTINSIVSEGWMDFETADDALLNQVRRSQGCLVTNDINLRLKARTVGVHVLDSAFAI